jgi:hypothetical protein
MSNIDKEDWHRIFYEENVAKSLYELKFCSGMKTRAYPYKFYFLRSFFWFFKTLVYQNPITKLDKHSKRHITIVILMVLTIIGMFYIAHLQGIF